MPERLPRRLRTRVADERGRPPCRCGGLYRQHNLLTGKCYCADGCQCTTYRGGLTDERSHETDNREDARRAGEFTSRPSSTSSGLLAPGYEPDWEDAR